MFLIVSKCHVVDVQTYWTGTLNFYWPSWVKVNIAPTTCVWGVICMWIPCRVTTGHIFALMYSTTLVCWVVLVSRYVHGTRLLFLSWSTSQACLSMSHGELGFPNSKRSIQNSVRLISLTRHLLERTQITSNNKKHTILYIACVASMLNLRLSNLSCVWVHNRTTIGRTLTSKKDS